MTTNNTNVVDQFQAAAYSAYHSACKAYNAGQLDKRIVERISIAREHSDEAVLCDAAGWDSRALWHIECAVNILSSVMNDIN